MALFKEISEHEWVKFIEDIDQYIQVIKTNKTSIKKLKQLFYHSFAYSLTLPMLRLLLSKEQGCKTCHVGIQLIALAEYCQMSFPHFRLFLHHFVLAKIATSSTRVNQFTLRAAKTGLTILEISFQQKHF